jgi:putative two-component system response regulator
MRILAVDDQAANVVLLERMLAAWGFTGVRGTTQVLGGSSSPLLRMAEVIARSHHERWDGSGYPAGLAGEAIPLHGRLVAVADVFDALTHARPYKAAMPVPQALAEMDAMASAFAPEVKAAFDRLDHREIAGG